MMTLVRSPLLDERRHGFSTRSGGVSTGPYATLNLGDRWGDAPDAVAENRRRLSRTGGFELSRLYLAHQVHGTVCVGVDGQDPATIEQTQADALWSAAPGTAVGVVTADCVPILFDDGQGRVAAAHAGWRGTVANIAGAVVAALRAAGAEVTRLRAAIGPSIGPCCFEVGEEVAAPFATLVPGSVDRDRPKPHVDLRLANVSLLREAGLRPEHIDLLGTCTCCERERFFSYRRDGSGIGQMMSFIVAGTGR